jgi:3-isopropylmalate dehydrogenase
LRQSSGEIRKWFHRRDRVPAQRVVDAAGSEREFGMNRSFNIAVIPGDGIGPEVVGQAERILQRAALVVGGFTLTLERYEAGAGCYRHTGSALPEATVAAARAADAVLLGACGLPDERYPDGTEIAPQVELRTILDLYAGIRPIRGLAGIPPVLARCPPETIDLVIVRESTEGLFASRATGIVLADAVATDTQVITRAGTERVVRAAFDWCRDRADARRQTPDGRGPDPNTEHRTPTTVTRVTCVDKANIFRSFAFFRRVFNEVAAEPAYAGIGADHCYVDAMALRLVRDPASLDVLVTENMFGDILSDLGAGLIGGMGVAPSADIGDRHAVFQPVHGSAPDIAGRGIANPVAAILSAAMQLDWLGKRHACAAARAAAVRIDAAVRAVLAPGTLLTPDLGGSCGTEELGAAIESALDAPEPKSMKPSGRPGRGPL